MGAEPLGDMGSGGGAEASRRIGAGRGDGPAEGLEQAGRDELARHPHRQGIEPRRGQQRDGAACFPRQHESQRSRPEALGQDPGALIHPHQSLGSGEVGQVEDEGIEARAVLGGEDCGDGAVIGGVRAEAIDRLGGKGHEPAGAKRFGRGRDVLRRRREDGGGCRLRAQDQWPRATKLGLAKPDLP